MSLSTSRLAAALPLPAHAPERPLEAILTASPEAFGVIYEHKRDRHDLEGIRRAIAHAEAFLADATHIADTLRQAVEAADVDTITRQLDAFVMAWPNASGSDLAGYGAQLAQDVIDREPCRYALRASLRHLRQTSRFLPSIAEVLTALDEAQARARNTAWHIGQIPAELEKARADLADAERREADRATRTPPRSTAPAHLQEPAAP